MNDTVQLIPIDRIRIVNPRHRDRNKFQAVIDSIKALGVKKPIQVNIRMGNDGEGPSYDLICGQGRIEACRILGFTEIPAIIVDISKEDRMLRSLVENMARRYPRREDLINEIERLKTAGYSNVEIAKKLDLSDVTVGGLLALKQKGEESLLSAALGGKIPISVAVEIAKTETVEEQREFLRAYESKQLNHSSIRTVKRLIEHRRFAGKSIRGATRGSSNRTSAESLVNAYKRETQRQRMIIKKARLCEAKLTLLVQAFTKLMADENFLTLLRAEGLATMPQFLADKINGKVQDAA